MIRLKDNQKNSWLNFAEINDYEKINVSYINKTKYSYFGITKFPKVEEQDSDVIYVIKKGDRLDSISYNFYGQVDLWWFIALRNDISLPVEELYIGRNIFIPPKDYILGLVQ